MTSSQPASGSKNILLIFISLSVWIGLAFLIVWPWIHQIDQQNLYFSIVAHINAGIWWIVLLWALHHLSYQVAALFKKKEQHETPIIKRRPTVAILYLTCDDFNASCCESCLSQDYRPAEFYICDDSAKKQFKDEIDQFCSKHTKGILRRRENRIGYKAGNINNAINKTDADWILLIDADQTLPKSYLSDLIRYLPDQPDSIAFVQGAHTTADLPQNSQFQQALSPEVDFFYSRDLSARSKYGFIPLLGHGALLNKSAWLRVGGIPEVVSEDFAFAMQSINNGLRGQYLEFVTSTEVYPLDFGGFLLRLRKFSGGTAELIHHELFHFLVGKGSFPEKWDMLFMLIWYLLMPLLVINGFLGSYVVHELWVDNISYLHPVLPYLYLWMFSASISLSVSSTHSFTKAAKFYFWSAAIYSASLPLASLSFLSGLFRKPQFKRTPKNAERTEMKILDSVIMVILGIAAIFCSYIWLSPFSPILAGQGVAYLCFPLYNQLNLNSPSGKIARFIIYIPGLAMIFALYAMWQWGRY
ncbi:MAG: glycosyltransferase [Chloroflexi bacterium]|nr:glycosyltransferase [Chloroflexota bacterium]